MNKFKVGDRIRYTGEKSIEAFKNATGIIVECNRKWGDYTIKCDPFPESWDDDHTYISQEDEIELDQQCLNEQKMKKLLGVSND